MNNEKMIKKLDKYAYKTDKGGEWHVSHLSLVLSGISTHFSMLDKIDKKNEKSYTDIQTAYHSIKKLEEYVYTIFGEAAPDFLKFAKRKGEFIKEVLEQAHAIVKRISPDKAIEIELASRLLEQMKIEQGQIKFDYDRLEKVINTNDKNSVMFEADDYLVVSHKTNAEKLKNQIVEISVSDELKPELDSIKNEASKLYKEISSAIKECYTTLQEVEMHSNSHLIRSDVYKKVYNDEKEYENEAE